MTDQQQTWWFEDKINLDSHSSSDLQPRIYYGPFETMEEAIVAHSVYSNKAAQFCTASPYTQHEIDFMVDLPEEVGASRIEFKDWTEAPTADGRSWGEWADYMDHVILTEYPNSEVAERLRASQDQAQAAAEDIDHYYFDHYGDDYFDEEAAYLQAHEYDHEALDEMDRDSDAGLDFGSALDDAWRRYWKQVANGGTDHLGVFADADDPAEAARQALEA